MPRSCMASTLLEGCVRIVCQLDEDDHDDGWHRYRTWTNDYQWKG